MQKPELLSPAGDFEALKAAFRFGADAVYLGVENFGMRANAAFSQEELVAAVQYAHERGKKVYVTLNTLPTNQEMAQLPRAIGAAAEASPDAFIVADLGVMALVQQMAPFIDMHVSTQAGIMNYGAAAAAYNLGAKRVVLARELSLQDIAFIRAHVPEELELEVFVHGSMCMAVSGRCLLSNYMAERDANRGACAQPCRWNYSLVEENRPGEPMPIYEEDGKSYILNADDLCMAPFIDLLAEVGVNSLKIEGRAKTAYYVASATSAYRRALDAYTPGEEFLCPVDVLEELTRVSHRRYSTGFYLGRENAKLNTKSGGYIREWEVVGIAQKTENGRVYAEQRGKFMYGDELEALTPAGEMIPLVAVGLQNEKGEEIESTPHAQMLFSFDAAGKTIPEHSYLRRKIPTKE